MLPWDKIIPNQVIKVWEKWESTLKDQNTSTNTITWYSFKRNWYTRICRLQYHWNLCSSIRSHSKIRPSQPTPDSKKVLTGKTKLSIPKLELPAVHIASNLAQNIRSALTDYSIRDIHGWNDCTVVLHWLKVKGKYKQFVPNRTNNINANAYVTWRHVPSNQTVDMTIMAATTGTMPFTTKHHDKWWIREEAKAIKTLLATRITVDHKKNKNDRLLLKHNVLDITIYQQLSRNKYQGAINNRRNK